MKLKRITLKFKEPLTKIITYQGQQVQIEEILITDINGVREEVRKRLHKMLKGLNLLRIINPAVIEMMKMRIAGVDHTFEWLVEFKKVSPTVFTFTYPLDLTALLTLKKWGLNIGPLKMKERDLHLAQLLKDKKIIEGLQLFTFKEMQLKEGDYQITTEEFESEPESIQSATQNTPPAEEPER